MFRSWVAHGVPLPPPATVTLVRYLAESGSTVTHSGVTNCVNCMKTSRKKPPPYPGSGTAKPLPNPKMPSRPGSGGKKAKPLPNPKRPPKGSKPKKPNFKPYGR